MATLEEDLRSETSAEVRFDALHRIVYSTDASPYRIEPLGGVLPRKREDIIRTIEVCAEHGATVLARGAGTSLTGQSLGRGVVVDFSRHMGRILAIDPEARRVRVEPGVVLDVLNRALRPHGLFFPIDTATSNRATIGGVIGNNSGGAHSLLYGRAVRHVCALDVVLADGSEARFEEIPRAEALSRAREQTIEGAAYREILRLAEENREEIAHRFPKVAENVGGYNLDAFTGPGPVNMARMIVGSEGTLGVAVEAELALEPLPKHTALGVLHFHALLEALEAVEPILASHPSAIELLGRRIVDGMRSTRYFSRLGSFIQGTPDALLLVEFYGETEEELEEKLGRLAQLNLGYALHAAPGAAEQARIWRLRKAGLGLLASRVGDRKPVTGIEDVSVSTSVLPRYVGRLIEEFSRLGVSAAMYAHASMGLIHTRPLLNLKSAEDVERWRRIVELGCELALEFGGAFSAEHGDGLLHSEFNEKFFGPRLYAAFRRVKATFDPEGRLNPGKIVDAPAMTENLRYGSAYRILPEEKPSRLDFSDYRGLAGAVEMCSGLGDCRKLTEGAMCPSFLATREELHSTRGRANVLMAAMRGDLPTKPRTIEEALSCREVREAMSLCLACKACKAECPSAVDMARLKYEFLAQYHEKRGTPRRARIFANAARWGRLGVALWPVSNWLLGDTLVRWLLEALFGIDRRRRFPRYARKSFASLLEAQDSAGAARAEAPRGEVVLFNDTFTNYHEPEIGLMTSAVLEAAGYRVLLPEVVCCGRPALSNGLVDQARKAAETNIKVLLPHVEAGRTVLGIEPSCIAMLRDDYPVLIPSEESRRVAAACLPVDEFLGRAVREEGLRLPLREPPAGEKRRLLYHPHCHQNAVFGVEGSVALLSSLPGSEVRLLDCGCCGMAGSFGYETERYEVSMAVAKAKLFPTIRARKEGTEVVAAGTSCRSQIKHGLGVVARHPIEMVAEALDVPAKQT